jgi:hypothetical protein
MPGGDRSGPSGAGPMTGRKTGYCAGYPNAGWQQTGWGKLGGAFRRGWGFHSSPRGLTRRRKFRGAVPTDHDALQAHRDALRSELDHIEQKLSAMNVKEGNK